MYSAKFNAGGNSQSGKSGSDTSVSLQEILDYVKVTREILEEPCTEGHLLEISKKIRGDWEVYAPYLGLSDDDIDALKMDHHQSAEIQSRRAFKLWEERAAFRATYLHLVENVFFKHGNAKMATFVCKLVKQ